MSRKFWSENVKGRDHSENLDVDEKIILEWILRKLWVIVDWMHLAGSYEHGNEPSGSIKGREFRD
jgi:hypothetical protein